MSKREEVSGREGVMMGMRKSVNGNEHKGGRNHDRFCESRWLCGLI